MTWPDTSLEQTPVTRTVGLRICVELASVLLETNPRIVWGLVRLREFMRIYYHSFWFWLRWVIWILLFVFIFYIAHFSNKGPMIGMTISGAAVIFFLYHVLVTEPYRIEVYTDGFVLRSVLRRKVYSFLDVSNITLDVVRQSREGILKIVRVDFSSGKTLRSVFPNVRQSLYENLYSNWRT